MMHTLVSPELPLRGRKFFIIIAEKWMLFNSLANKLLFTLHSKNKNVTYIAKKT